VSEVARMGEHVSIQATGVWRALSLFLLPVGLSIAPDPWSVPVLMRWAAVVGLAVMALVAVVVRKRLPGVALALGWVMLSVSPRFLAVSAGEPLHEHQVYVAMVGLSVLAGWAFSQLQAGERVYA
jgi:hypothetical protein